MGLGGAVIKPYLVIFFDGLDTFYASPLLWTTTPLPVKLTSYPVKDHNFSLWKARHEKLLPAQHQ